MGNRSSSYAVAGGGIADCISNRLPLCSDPRSNALGAFDPSAQVQQQQQQQPEQDDCIDVWILAGQSNAVGDNAADEMAMPPSAQPLPGRILM